MQAAPKKPPPPVIKLGAGAHYTRLDVLADAIGSSEKGIRTLLGALGSLPICHFPETGEVRYVLTYAFESAMFALGMPSKIKENPDLLRVHQELAGVLYGTLTAKALKERVKLLAKELTSDGREPKMKKKTRRDPSAYRTWSGRSPTG